MNPPSLVNKQFRRIESNIWYLSNNLYIAALFYRIFDADIAFII